MASRMPQAPGVKREPSSPVRLVVVLLGISLVLFTLSVREGGTGPISTVEGAVQVVCAPLRYVGAVVCSPFTGLSNLGANLTADSETLSELKAQNEKLLAENAQLKESAQAANRLEGLLELQDNYNLKSTGARVISGSLDSLSSTITIDKGSLQGIAVGMPVTDSMGIIGQVSAVSPTSSQVRLITDDRSSVSAMVQESRAQGQAQGQGTDMLQLNLVRADQSVSVGDLVVTSGLDGVFPKGLLIGTITSADKPSGALYYNILVKPAASVSNLEEVLVITSLTDDQTASASDVAADDAQEAGKAPAQSNAPGSTGGAASSTGASREGAQSAAQAQSGAAGEGNGDAQSSSDGSQSQG